MRRWIFLSSSWCSVAPVPSRGIASRRDSPIRLRICVTAVSFCALCALGWKVMLNVVISPFGIFLEIQPWLFFFFESILEMKQIGYNVSLGFKIWYARNSIIPKANHITRTNKYLPLETFWYEQTEFGLQPIPQLISWGGFARWEAWGRLWIFSSYCEVWTPNTKWKAMRRQEDPRAMLVTEIGGARPPNEIVLD